jgi:hypothetical protein
MTNHPWIRLRHGNTAISCDRCGQIAPLPENQTLDRFAAILYYFTAQHRHCEPDWTKHLIAVATLTRIGVYDDNFR